MKFLIIGPGIGIGQTTQMNECEFWVSAPTSETTTTMTLSLSSPYNVLDLALLPQRVEGVDELVDDPVYSSRHIILLVISIINSILLLKNRSVY